MIFNAPQKKFSKEQIIESAFYIAQQEGIDKLTIRKVADHLGSSVAPIYVNFNEVEELKRTVTIKIMEWIHQKTKEKHSGNRFADLRIANLKMAMEYPALMKDFVLTPNEYVKDYDHVMSEDLVNMMKQDPALEGFTEKELLIILLKMRIFQTGLTLMVTNVLLTDGFSSHQIIELSDSVAEAVVQATRLPKEDR